MKLAIPELKDRAILAGWIAGLLLIGGLIWIPTQSLQARYLMRAVNSVLVTEEGMAGENERQLTALEGRRFITINPMGIWYSLSDSNARMVVSVIMWEGILIPFGALISPEGTVEEQLVPLSRHAKQLLPGLPPGIVEMYIRRIEAAAAERDR